MGESLNSKPLSSLKIFAFLLPDFERSASGHSHSEGAKPPKNLAQERLHQTSPSPPPRLLRRYRSSQ